MLALLFKRTGVCFKTRSVCLLDACDLQKKKKKIVDYILGGLGFLAKFKTRNTPQKPIKQHYNDVVFFVIGERTSHER